MIDIHKTALWQSINNYYFLVQSQAEFTIKTFDKFIDALHSLTKISLKNHLEDKNNTKILCLMFVFVQAFYD